MTVDIKSIKNWHMAIFDAMYQIFTVKMYPPNKALGSSYNFFVLLVFVLLALKCKKSLICFCFSWFSKTLILTSLVLWSGKRFFVHFFVFKSFHCYLFYWYLHGIKTGWSRQTLQECRHNSLLMGHHLQKRLDQELSDLLEILGTRN